MAEGPPVFTVAMIMWGDAFGPAFVNRIVEDVLSQTAERAQILLFTDRHWSDLAPDVEQREIPSFWLSSERKRGCLTKLMLYERGCFEGDQPVIFLDLDTIVQGDIGVLANWVQRRGHIWACPASFVPIRPLRGAITSLLGRRNEGRFNSSVCGFLPRDVEGLADAFRDEVRQIEDQQGARPKYFADDRWLSHHVPEALRTWPSALALKFSDALATPLDPRSIANRAARARSAITLSFPGKPFGPERLVEAKDGERLEDGKSRVMHWDDAHTGNLASDVRAHWRGVLAERDRLMGRDQGLRATTKTRGAVSS